MEHDIVSEPESDSVINSSKDAMNALQSLQEYALGRGDENVFSELSI